MQIQTSVVLLENSTNLQYVFGHPKAEAPEILSKGPSLFLHVRTALREGRVIFVDIDRGGRNGALLLNPRFIRFAALNQTPVLFWGTRLSGRRIEVFFSGPHSEEQLTDADACLHAFRTFMDPFVKDGLEFCWEEWRQ